MTAGIRRSRAAASSARSPSDKIGCVRRFKLQDGAELREQLLALSDLEQSFSYCLLDTPIPMFNYVAHVRLLPVTDGDRTFWHWGIALHDADRRPGPHHADGLRGYLPGRLRGHPPASEGGRVSGRTSCQSR